MQLSPIQPQATALPAPLLERAARAPEAQVPADSFEPQAPQAGREEEGGSSKLGKKLFTTAYGALVGTLMGAAGPNGAVAAAGLGAGVATVATFGPHLKDSIKEGLSGEPVNDAILLTTAGLSAGVVLTSFTSAAGVMAWAVGQAVPGLGPVIGAVAGAAAGASIRFAD